MRDGERWLSLVQGEAAASPKGVVMASSHHRHPASTDVARGDATSVLREDHQKVRRLFRRFDALADDARKADLIQQVCTELKVHAMLEEELFYPAADGRIAEEMLLEEAQVDHDCIRQLIEMLENDQIAPEERYATFRVLAEYVLHHIEEEENELFRQMRDAGIDMAELGARMQSRRHQLHQEWDMLEESVQGPDGRNDRIAVQQAD
jgi:hemerythrin-like domain-containing protein